MTVSSCTFYDDYIEHAIEDIFIFGQIAVESKGKCNITKND